MAGLRALVIDDDKEAPTHLATSLRRLGVIVTDDPSAEQGLGEIESAADPFQLIFIDHQLPGCLNSLESVRRLRRSLRAGAANPDHPYRQPRRWSSGRGARAAGANSILFKPFTVSHLLDSLVSLLGALEIQRRRREPVRAERLEEAREAVSGARVLVVEDNHINQQIARELLEQAGVIVDIVGNGKDATDWVLGTSPSDCPWNVILMDLQMPVMDGYTATGIIRRDHRFWAAWSGRASRAPPVPHIRPRGRSSPVDQKLSHREKNRRGAP